MTETTNVSQDETKNDAAQPPQSLPNTKTKIGKQTSDGNERSKSSEKVEKPPTKVVVRRLPPTMSLETFLDQVAPLPPVDYMYFVKADASLAPNSFGRAYLHFVHVTDLLIFTEKFDNYVFVDSKGNEYPAIVEYAPFQRIPKQRSTRKKDPRVGTIESDPYYQDFIEALKAEETQRKSASKTNKQHFFETSASAAVPKVTSTPLLEFLKARRADKLKTKEDKIAERKKRETERRKAREDARTAVKPVKHGDGDGEVHTPLTPQIKPPQSTCDPTSDLAEIQTRYLRCMIGLDTDTSGLEQIASHGPASDKQSKEMSDSKRFSKESAVKEVIPKRREDDRTKLRDREKERRDKEREGRESHKDQRRDARKDTTKDQASSSDKDKDKDKENQPTSAESRSKETRRSGKSYQEERQRLNDRRQAAKGSASKPVSNDKTERDDESLNEESAMDKKYVNKREIDAPSDSRGHHHEKYRSSDQHKQQSSKKFEKPRNTKDQEQRRGHDSRKNADDHPSVDGKDVRRNVSSEKNHDGKHTPTVSLNDLKSDETANNPCQLKEETRKKSYNQEREQRRAAAADRKNQNRRDSIQSGKSDERLTSSKGNFGSQSEGASDSNENTKHVQTAERLKSEKGRRPSLDNAFKNKKESSQEEPSRSKSLADMKTSQAPSKKNELSNDKRKESTFSKGDDKDKKDPRAERRIRNKDRPSIEIYRPGMGRFSRQRLEREKGLNKGSSTERDSPSSSPSPVPAAVKTAVMSEKNE